MSSSASAASVLSEKTTSYFVAIQQIDPALDSAASRDRLLNILSRSVQMLDTGSRSIALIGRRPQAREETVFKFLSNDPARPLVVRVKGANVSLQTVDVAQALHAARVSNRLSACANAPDHRSLKITCADVLRVLQRGPLLMIEETLLPGQSLMQQIVELGKRSDSPRDAIVLKAFVLGATLLRLHALGFAHGELRLQNCRASSEFALGVSGLWRAVQLPDDRPDLSAALRLYDVANALLLLRKDMRSKAQDRAMQFAMETALLSGYFVSDDFVDSADDLLRCARAGGTLKSSEGGSVADAVLAVALAKSILEPQYENFWRAAVEADRETTTA